jgi:septum formation protein
LRPVILASKSAARAQILRQAGVAFEIASSGVDEDRLKAEALSNGRLPGQIAETLAEAKALAVSRSRPGLVIGADQTLEFEGRLFDKAASTEDAERRFAELRGRTHHLHSAVTLASGGAALWRERKTASLTMRAFSDAYLQGYMARNAEIATACVGGYAWEGEGVQLFESVEGDYFTILGLPILGLLAELRRLGAVEQ